MMRTRNLRVRVKQKKNPETNRQSNFVRLVKQAKSCNRMDERAVRQVKYMLKNSLFMIYFILFSKSLTFLIASTDALGDCMQRRGLGQGTGFRDGNICRIVRGFKIPEKSKFLPPCSRH